MNLEEAQLNDIRQALQRYYQTGPFQSQRMLTQLMKSNITKQLIEETSISRTVATLSRKLANHEDEEDREVADLASKLTVRWKKLFQ